MTIQPGPNETNNLLDWHDVTKFTDELSQEKELSEMVIYQIFKGQDEKKAFNDAIELWGKRFPFISFLFFLKDKDRYVPVRPDAMKERFISLGFPVDCLKTCSWENYQEIIQLMNNLKETLQKEVDPETDLLDAHSFMWSTWLLKDTTPDVLLTQVNDIDDEVSKKGIVGETRDAVVKIRVNQSEFRKRLKQRYGHCCLCGVSEYGLLNASHIKPWSVSNKNEKVDVDNGFLLCPNHDKLFDQGYITFTDDGMIAISSQLGSNDRIFLNVVDRMHIELTEGNKKYLEYHRNNVFKK